MEIRLNSNVLQRCVNMNQCGWDFILITQSTVELPSALQKGKKKKGVSVHLCNLTVREKKEETTRLDLEDTER